MRRHIAAEAAMVLLACGVLMAQDRQISPSRGFQPAHSFSLDGIESIDKGTGNLSLHFAITQLPPGPAGFTAGVTLSYSNRYWNAERVHSTGTEYDLKQSLVDGGGWHLSMAPRLEVQFVPDFGDFDPCVSPTGTMRLAMISQDGSSHSLYRSAPVPSTLAACAGSYPVSEMSSVSSSWFSADGSFLRLVIGAPTGSGFWPNNAPWTLYRADGSRAAYEPTTGLTTLYDRNGNSIVISEGTQTGGTYQLMTDAYGRTIRIDHYTAAPVRDTITQTGHDGQPLIWTINWTDFPAITEPTTFKSRPTGNQTLDFDYGLAGMLVSSLVLPNNLSYAFAYTSRYRELSDLTLPTGAAVKYQYRLDPNTAAVNYYHIIANTITSREITHDGTTNIWTYSYDVGSTGTYSTSSTIAPDGGKSAYEFYPVSYQFGSIPLGGTLKKIVNPDGSETLKEWAFNVPAELNPASLVFPNQWLQRELTTVANSTPSGTAPNYYLGTPTATSIQAFTVDKNGNQTSREERGWIAYSATPPATSTATLLRKSISTYANGASDSTVATADVNAYSHPSATSFPKTLPTSKEVQTGGGTVTAKDTFTYTAAGNLWQEYHWDSTKAATLATGTALTDLNAVKQTYTYTAKGNLVSETDARGKATTYAYTGTAGCGTDLYRTGMTRGGDGSIAQTTTYASNCNSGLRTTVTDPAGIITSIAYDPYGRPTSFTEGASRKTTHEYNDTSRWIVSRNDAEANNDQRSVSILHFDQLGRIRQSRQLETSMPNSSAASDETAGIRTDTRYVYAAGAYAAGRNDVLVSNPYNPLTEGSAPTRGWTVTRRDKAGRICLEEKFAGPAEPTVETNCNASGATVGKTNRSYTATVSGTLAYRSESVSDAAGATRTMYFDALGRMIAVVEDPSVLKYSTYYGYDFNDNLTDVRQAGTCPNPMTSPCAGGLVRTFTYSSLNRLLTANNPENGSISYGYDNSGNVVRRQQGTAVRCAGPSAAGGVCQPDAGYDDLNRLVAQSYNDSTPAVMYTYDTENAANRPASCAGTSVPLGRLSSVSNSVSTSYYYHTELGYPLCNRQLTNSTAYDFAYTTSPQGAIRSLRYPSGRVVNSTFDDAGRITAVASGAKNYATGVQYASHGPIKSLTLGNGLVESWTYNSRLQPSQMQAGTLLTLGLYYCPGQAAACASNNGNLSTQTITRPAGGWTQNYTYDNVDRLKTAAETGSGTWNQSYGYDALGNRWVCAHGGTAIPSLTLETPQNVGDCGTTAWFTGQNRITNWGYEDGRGNVTSVGAMTRAFTYDGENRQLTATINEAVSVYSYDGEGRRVKAATPSGTTIFVYDAQGRLAVEYAPGGETNTHYLTADHLGSTRIITTGTTAPAVYKELDYLPFGEELKSGMGGAARGASFDGLGNRMKFTGKERDGETGLDYFGGKLTDPNGDKQGQMPSQENSGSSNLPPGLRFGDFISRYYSSAQGRFTSPDFPLLDQSVESPQSWNLFSYVMNNPLTFFDPNGGKCKKTKDGFEGDCGSPGDEKVTEGDKAQVANVNGQQGSLFGLFMASGVPRYVPNDKPLPENGRKVITVAYLRTQHDLGCVGLGGAITGGSVAASSPIIPKPFSAGGVSSTSPASKVLGGINIGKSIPTPVGMPGTSSLAWRASANLGRIAGRYLPYVGTVVGAAATHACLSY